LLVFTLISYAGMNSYLYEINDMKRVILRLVKKLSDIWNYWSGSSIWKLITLPR